MIVAGIDIGTLTCRLLIADVTPDGSLREIDSDRRILRLGEGVDREGKLNVGAMKRVIDVLGEWQKTISRCQIEAMVLVATSAVREASNQQEFLERIKQETGFSIDVLSGDEEARRTLLGLKFGLPPDVDDYVGLDIGGGSTEWIRMSGDGLPVVASLDIGVVRVTERCFESDPPHEQDVLAAEQLIKDHIHPIQQHFDLSASVTLVGTAGTVTTLAAMAQQLRQYRSARIHNYWLTLEKIRELENDLRSRTRAQRIQLPGLEAGREGVIVAGTIILRTMMDMLGFTRCLVSDYGLREGILIDLMNKKKRDG
ncbi:MAG: exopolyphosphatase [Nitrospirales bacterium]|nr:MAG: exopolyphosphatase [Nitrospirales bacterium]